MSSQKKKTSSEIKMVSYDIVLTHTSQVFSPNMKKTTNKSVKKTRKEEVNKKSLHSKSLQGPLLPPNIHKASENASISGLQLAHQLDRNNIKHDLRVDRDLEEVNSVISSFENQLRDFSRYKAPAKETPEEKKKRVLYLTLQMPNYIRLLCKISHCRRRRIFSQVFHEWKTSTLAMRALEKFIYGKRLEATLRIQRAWRRRVEMMKYRRKEYLAMKAKEQRDREAADRIIQYVRNIAQCRIARKILASRRRERNVRLVTIVQKVFRGWVARSERAERLRLMLIEDLRDWAGGNMQKLIERPSNFLFSLCFSVLSF